MHSITKWLHLRLMALGAVCLLAAACSQPAPVPEKAVVAADYSFTGLDNVAGGIQRFKLNNTGNEEHHAVSIQTCSS